jgi:subtilisin family serine protease
MTGEPADRCFPGTGRGVRIAVVDSGVHARHPHVREIAGGIAIGPEGTEHPDYVDRLGHGTAVTAAIKEKAPDAELFAVKVFDRALATDVAALVHAIDWAAQSGMHVVNLSLGTARPAHEPALDEAVKRARQAGMLVVAAGWSDGVRWLPGSLPGVVSVEVDWSCPRNRYRAGTGAHGEAVFRASGFPREIPGVPPSINLKGISFAVANMTGFVARAIETRAGVSFDELVGVLRAGQDPLQLTG